MAMPMSGTKATFYLPEVTYGTMVTSGAWQWFGLVNPISPVLKKDNKRITYLGDALSDISKVTYVDAGASINTKLTYVAQDYDFFNAFAHGNLAYFSLAQIIENEAASETWYIVYKGCTVDTATLTYNEFGEIVADYDITIGDVADPSVTDPSGAGSWETESTDDPLMWADVTNLQWNSAAFSDSAGTFKFTVKSELKYPRDKNTASWTKIGGPLLNLREYEFSIDLTYQSLGLFANVKNRTQGDIEWTSDGEAFKATNMFFDTFDATLDPDDYFGSTMVAKSRGTVFTVT
jgi:hypothetical protein